MNVEVKGVKKKSVAVVIVEEWTCKVEVVEK